MIDDLPSRVARVEQRVTDIESRVNSMLPITATVVMLTERVQQVRDDFAQFREKVDEREAAWTARADTDSRERRSVRLALLAMTLTLLCALIGAAATIAAAGGFH